MQEVPILYNTRMNFFGGTALFMS